MLKHSHSAPRREMTRFMMLFCGTAIGLVVLTSGAFARDYVHQPLSEAIARASRWVLSAFGPTRLDGRFVSFRDFSVSVVDACDGILPTCVYVAAVLAFPRPWSARLRGLALGIPSILLINTFRIVTLLVLGAWHRDAFEGVHIYVWQTLLIVLSLALWLIWVDRYDIESAPRLP